MVAHYARMHDSIVRRHWERTRKVNASGQAVTLDPHGPLAEAPGPTRLARVTQSLPNGYCGLPVQNSCPHANACLTCPFVTTPEFLPQYREQRRQVVEIISASEARGQQCVVERNQEVLGNLDAIITALAADADPDEQQVADAADNSKHVITAAKRRHDLTRAKAIKAIGDSPKAASPWSS